VVLGTMLPPMRITPPAVTLSRPFATLRWGTTQDECSSTANHGASEKWPVWADTIATL